VFSEALVAPLSGIELTMTGMPGMANHQPMPIRGFTTQVTDKTMTVNLPRALPAGTYQLTWHVVGADQHRIQNSYTFTAN
jgi:methionine-rich copper-binding protein CopC